MAKKEIMSVETANAALVAEVEKFNSVIKSGNSMGVDGIRNAEADARKAYVKKAIGEYAEGKENIIKEYIMGDRFVSIPSVDYDGDTGMAEIKWDTALNAKQAVIPFAALNSASGSPLANYSIIKVLLRIFSENLYTACSKSVDNGVGFAKQAMDADLLTMRKKVASQVGAYWDSTSMTSVQKQLGHLFKLYLGKEAPEVVRAAVKYMEWALINAKRAKTKDDMGKTVYEDNTAKIEEFIFNAMKTLIAGEAFECATRPGEVSKATEKAVGKMNNLPKEYTETAKGGRVRTGSGAARRKDKETQVKQEESVKAEETKEETAA